MICNEKLSLLFLVCLALFYCQTYKGRWCLHLEGPGRGEAVSEPTLWAIGTAELQSLLGQQFEKIPRVTNLVWMAFHDNSWVSSSKFSSSSTFCLWWDLFELALCDYGIWWELKDGFLNLPGWSLIFPCPCFDDRPENRWLY
jgi:hypothetical protein